MQWLAFHRFSPDLAWRAWLPVALLLVALIQLVRVLTAPAPAAPPLPPVVAPASKQAPTRPDPFPLAWTEEAFALSRLNEDDPRLFDAPVSGLPFSVAGILSSSDPRKSHAILTAGSQQLTVSVGDMLDGTAARVVRIFADRLILAHQERYEALLMPSDPQTTRL